jgi:signal transduction histidine kinase
MASIILDGDDRKRVEALRAYRILDTAAEPEFDDLTRLASQICRAPIAMITLIDSDRQWFKSRVGVDVTQTPLSESICSHAMRGSGLFVVPDLRKDARFANYAMVVSDPRIRFYAGIPLINPEGHALGTLCVVDTILRQLRPDQAEAMKVLGRQVVSQIELKYGARAGEPNGQAYAALELENTLLKQSVKAMERSIGIAAHELKNPLAGIRIMAEFLGDPQAKALPQWESTRLSLSHEADRMLDTVDTLLEAARLNSGRANWNWSFFDLDPICRDVLENTRIQLAGKQIKLSYDLDAFGQFMRGDAGAIRRLLLNLLGNARKYTASGEIHISVNGEFTEGHRWVELKVSDTGQGIPTQFVDGLGEAFALNTGVVGENIGSGTGLGLSICKGIAAAHGGSMRIKSELGRGTSVVARLRADLTGPASVAPGLSLLEFTRAGTGSGLAA